jgi:hypothetical protein
VFFVGGFWEALAACVNGGAFRQDERDGQDALRVGAFDCEFSIILDLFYHREHGGHRGGFCISIYNSVSSVFYFN